MSLILIAGLLTDYLAYDAATVRNLLGDFYSVAVLSLFTVLFGLGSALFACYPLALVVLGCIPVVVLSFVLTRGVGLLLRFWNMSR